jgi:hypothetical protein
MGDLCRLIWCGLIRLFRSRVALEAEILVLRHQLNVLRRKSPKRVALSSIDRLLLVGLYRLVPGVLDALKIIRPETLMGWHRAGFRAYWRWKSRLGSRPRIAADIRRLIREMSVANPLWGAPRITANCSSSASMSDSDEALARDGAWSHAWPRGLAEAIRYALSRWTALCRFLDDGRIDLDNNPVECAIRPIALGRTTCSQAPTVAALGGPPPVLSSPPQNSMTSSSA